MRFDRAALKNEVKTDLKQSRPRAILVSLVYLLVTNALVSVVDLRVTNAFSGYDNIIEQMSDLSFGMELGMISSEDFLTEFLDLFRQLIPVLVVALVGILIIAVINWTANFAYRGYCLKMVRREDPGFITLLSAFPRWGWVLLTGFLVALFTILWSILFIILGILATVLLMRLGMGIVVLIWAAVAAGIIYIYLRYCLAFYILADEKIDSLEAISRSKAMMRGRKWSMFVLELSFIGWILVYFLAFAVVSLIVSIFTDNITVNSVLSSVITLPLLMWLTPYMTGSVAKFYDWMKLTDQEQGVWEGTYQKTKETFSQEQPKSEPEPEPKADPEPAAEPIPLPEGDSPLQEPNKKNNAPDRPDYE